MAAEIVAARRGRDDARRFSSRSTAAGSAAAGRWPRARRALRAVGVRAPGSGARRVHRASTVDIVRCRDCGFAQPAALPALPRFFDRMYDQRWSDDWIAREHHAAYKDRIFADILAALERAAPRPSAGACSTSARTPAGSSPRARRAGWDAEGLELNPETAAFAAHATGARRAPGQRLHLRRRRGRLRRGDADRRARAHSGSARGAAPRARRCSRPAAGSRSRCRTAPAQRFKEAARARASTRLRGRPRRQSGARESLFCAASLRRALERKDSATSPSSAGAPEYAGRDARRRRLVRARRFHCARASLPGAVHTPLAFNLQAYARR